VNNISMAALPGQNPTPRPPVKGFVKKVIRWLAALPIDREEAVARAFVICQFALQRRA